MASDCIAMYSSMCGFAVVGYTLCFPSKNCWHCTSSLVVLQCKFLGLIFLRKWCYISIQLWSSHNSFDIADMQLVYHCIEDPYFSTTLAIIVGLYHFWMNYWAIPYQQSLHLLKAISYCSTYAYICIGDMHAKC